MTNWRHVMAMNVETLREAADELDDGVCGGFSVEAGLLRGAADWIDDLKDQVDFHRETIDSLNKEVHRLDRFIRDSGTSCWACEACGRGRTSNGCLWCDNTKLKADLKEAKEKRYLGGIIT